MQTTDGSVNFQPPSPPPRAKEDVLTAASGTAQQVVVSVDTVN